MAKKNESKEPQEEPDTFEEMGAENNTKPPIVSVYSLIRNDIWSAFHEFSIEFGVMCGLRNMDKDMSKEFVRASARAVAYAVQFYQKIAYNFPDTFALLDQQDQGDGQDIEKFGTQTANYLELMRRITNGIVDEKGKAQKFKPNFMHISFMSSYMARFLHTSGISSIEGRFDDERDQFAYGS